MLLNVLQEAGDIDLQNERTPSHYTPVPESLSFALIHIDLPTWWPGATEALPIAPV